MHYLESLNPQQQQAVLHIEGPLLVIAGAGTGKTKTLTHRILYLIHLGIAPENILAITFTNKAASEMRERVIAMMTSDPSIPTVSTFHALGVRILRQHHQKIKVNKYFNILDSQDKMTLIKQAMKQEDIDTKQWEPRTIASVISRAKADEKTAETFAVNNNPLSEIVRVVWSRYEALKRAEQSLDFDDLLSDTYRLLKDNPDILAIYQQRWQYIHVDEYQDTNTIQYKIIKLLAEKHKNICAVGDGDQNIYSWRGADMKNILNFEKDFPGSHVVILENNYRSTKRILEASHQVISKNTERVEKKLVTDNAEGEKVMLYEAFSGHQEASWVANQVMKYREQGIRPGDMAVLFRTNFQSRLLEEAFLQYAIPYHVVGVKFFQRKEIKDIMSYLKTAFNNDSLSDVKRTINEPKRGLGKIAVAHVFAGQVEKLSPKARASYEAYTKIINDIRLFADNHLPSETVKYAIKHSGFENILSGGTDDDKERLENMKELVTYAKKYDDRDNPYDDFFEEVALLSDQDSMEDESENQGTVKLMTIHAAKGLEFSHVFVVGLEQGLFPSQRDDNKNKYEEEEERRLCYVAFTRAKHVLHLSYAKLRTIYGQERINEPSEFIRDLDEALIDYAEDSYTSNNRGGKTYYDDDGDEIETFYLDF